MNRKKILKQILESKILDKYILRDRDLANLVDKLALSLENWQNLKSIYVSDQKNTQASEAILIFEQRLNFMLSESKTSSVDYSETIKSTFALIDYMKAHPDAVMVSAIFNCDEYHYSVEVGILNQKIDVICVLKGGHIPENLL